MPHFMKVRAFSCIRMFKTIKLSSSPSFLSIFALLLNFDNMWLVIYLVSLDIQLCQARCFMLVEHSGTREKKARNRIWIKGSSVL